MRIGVQRDPPAARSPPSPCAGAAPRATTIDVLPPLGHFTTAFDAGPDPALRRDRRRLRHHAGALAGRDGARHRAGAAGSPLLYGNRAAGTRDVRRGAGRPEGPLPRPAARGARALPRAAARRALLSGRIDAARLRDDPRHAGLLEAGTVDEWFLCGPYGMVLDAQARAGRARACRDASCTPNCSTSTSRRRRRGVRAVDRDGAARRR